MSVAGQNTTATDYISGIQYKNNGAAIDFIQTEEGKVVQVSPGVYDYYYYLGDNLGNTRVTFDTQSGTATPLQQDDYYPFGMEINRNVNGTKNEYLYNKKELQEELGQYDYGARFYDPVIGRWNVVDAYAEHPDQIDLSPYVYVGDNPVDKTDPDGNCPTCLTALAGALIGGGIELGSQLLSGKSISEVDWADVGVETLKGALVGSGVGAGYVAAAEIGGVAIKASVDVTVKDGNKNIFDGTKSVGEAGFDAGADVVAGKVAGAIGKKITGILEKGLENSVKAETKAASSLVKAENAFNKATDGGRNMFGAKSMTAATKLGAAQSTSQAARKAVVRSQMATAVSKGAVGSAVKNGAQNTVVDKVKNFFGF